jgi:hypothetical protein
MRHGNGRECMALAGHAANCIPQRRGVKTDQNVNRDHLSDGIRRPVISPGWRTTVPPSPSDFRRSRTDGQQTATALLPNCPIRDGARRNERPRAWQKCLIL